MSTFKNRLLLFAILAAAWTAVSCGRSAQSYVELGNNYYKQGKNNDASINYRKALQKDPQSGEAYFGLGRALSKEGNAQEAYYNLTRAEQLLPGREDVKIELADFSLAVYMLDPAHPQKLYDDVTRISRDLLKKNARSFDGLRFAGAIALSDRKYADAAADMEKADSVKAMDPHVVGPWVDALFQLNEADRAEKLALALIQQHKDFTPIYDVLYQRYMAANRAADAEKLLVTEIQNNPTNKEAILQLARYYANAQKPADSTAALNKLLADPKSFPDAHADLGDFYLAAKNFDEAAKQYDQGLRANPAKKELYQRKSVNLLLAEQKRPDALALLEEMIKADPKNDGDKAMRAALLLDSGRPDAAETAIADLEPMVKSKPHDSGLAYTLGRAYFVKGDLISARANFLEALKRDNRAIPPRVYLAAIGQRRNDYAETMRYANEVLAVDPKDSAGRYWHAVGLRGLGNYDQAETEFARLNQEFPGSEDIELQVAMLRMAQKKYKEAETIFSRLYKAGSTDTRPLAGLTLATVAQGQIDSAVAALQGELQRTPGSVQLHSMLASMAATGGKPDLAVAENQWLIKNNPKDADAYVRLADAYRQKGDNAAAMSAAQKASDLAPRDANVQASAAYLKTLSGRPEDAVGDYRRLLTIDPNDPTTLNNLAFLLAEQGRDLDEALSLAGRATQKNPESLGFRDTLAWVYIKKNMNDSAIQVLKRLVLQDPNDPSFHYHLGMAYLQKGDKQDAKAELALALTHKPGSDIADKIKQAMARIG